jgi:DNA polymerase-4
MVTDIIAEKAPVYEKTSVDEHYIDLTGMDRFFGNYKWSEELRGSIIKNTGLPISFGLSLNKTVSKIATGEAKPNNGREVRKEQVKSFLSPLPIRKIPGIGNKTFQMLRTMGIITIETLSKIPLDVMERMLGKNGVVIWKKANGIDSTPVKPYTERKSISTEQTFDQDSTDVKRMNEIIATMVEKIAFELRKKQKLTSCITIKIRYSNFDTHTLQKRIAYTSFDHTLTKVAKELFKKLYTRRMLIRLIGVKFSHLVHGFQQLNLFEDTPEMVNMYLAMDKIRRRYGSRSIRKAISLSGRDDGVWSNDPATSNVVPYPFMRG